MRAPREFKPQALENNNLQVNPEEIYQNEPAPMGLADYGIGPNDTAYEYNTTSFLGSAQIYSLSVANSTTGNQWMSFQLNVNLAFNNSYSVLGFPATADYVYWVQDVAFLNTSSGEIYFIDNIWNMTSSGANMYNSTVTGNGTIGNSSGTLFYYSFASSTLPGNLVNLVYPASIYFMVNSTIRNGLPELSFMYNDGYGWVTYDNPIFTFPTDLTGDRGFVVDGNSYEPDGYSFYDAELILGGPGGGSSTVDVKSDVSLRLQYWNGHNYQEIANAYDFGSDTAETIGNIMPVGGYTYYISNGTIFENLITGSGTLRQMYNSQRISLLNISMPFSSGSLYINGTVYKFVDNGINLTVAPGEYRLEIYDKTTLYETLTVDLGAGEYLPLHIAKKSNIVFTETGLLVGTTWYVNVTESTGQVFLESSTINTISLTLVNGSYRYTVSTSNKIYEPSRSSGSFTVIGAGVYRSITFSPVTYTVTFTEAGLPSGTMWVVNLTNNQSSVIIIGGYYSVSLTNGTYTFIIANLSGYYPGISTFTIGVYGSDVTETVHYYHWAYITGVISPVNATTTINGKLIPMSSGNFNVSVRSGTYYVVVSETGYTTYYDNFTLSSGSSTNLATNLVPISKPLTTPTTKPSPISSTDIYIIIGVVVAVAVIGGVVVLIRRK